jgi:surface carbohydrate biosynthesis protein
MYLYISIETYAREFKPKLYTAFKILEKNSSLKIVLLDQKYLYYSLRMNILPAGIILLKSAQHYMLNFLTNLKNKGFTILLMDEEGLVTFSDQDEPPESRNSLDCLKLCESIFCWNEHEVTTLAKSGSNINQKIIVTGNPRTKLLVSSDIEKLYFDELVNIKAKYPRFILYNANHNPGYRNLDIKSTKDYLDRQFLAENRSRAYIRMFMDWSEQVRYGLFGFLDFARRFKESYTGTDYIIIYRPHPGEDQRLARYLLQDLDFIKIDDKYSVVPWLISAEAVISSTCTTLIESALLNKKTFAFLPGARQDYDHLRLHVSNNVAEIIFEPEDLISRISTLFQNNSQETKGNSIRISPNKLAATELETFSLISDQVGKILVQLKEQGVSNSRCSLWLIELNFFKRILDIAFWLRFNKVDRKRLLNKFLAPIEPADVAAVKSCFEKDSFSTKEIFSGFGLIIKMN